MLIKVTNRCGMGCSHCMESSTPAGTHMPIERFERALDCVERVEGLAHQIGYNLILLSGGECTEHPEIVTLVERVIARGWLPILLSNGLFLEDDELREALLRPEWPQLRIQVTHDPRFYPKKPPTSNDPRIMPIDSLTLMIPLGRFKGKTHEELPTRKGPTSFNIRSMTRHFGDIRIAIAQMRMRVLQGAPSGHCSPSISHTGAFVAGETNACFRVGTIDSSPEELTKGILEMRCNRCGLVDNLSQEQKRAIGEARLFAAGEGQ